MNRRLQLVFACGLGIVVLILIARQLWHSNEPAYGDQPLSAWLAQLDDHKADKAIIWTFDFPAPSTPEQEAAA